MHILLHSVSKNKKKVTRFSTYIYKKTQVLGRLKHVRRQGTKRQQCTGVAVRQSSVSLCLPISARGSETHGKNPPLLLRAQVQHSPVVKIARREAEEEKVSFSSFFCFLNSIFLRLYNTDESKKVKGIRFAPGVVGTGDNHSVRTLEQQGGGVRALRDSTHFVPERETMIRHWRKGGAHQPNDPPVLTPRSRTGAS